MKFKIKKCKHCQKDFEPTAPSHLYCEESCSKRGLIDNYYKNVYDVSITDVEEMLEKQGGVCAICKEPGFNMNEYVRSPLNVDHCHETGTVRGLLCHNCNRALGLLKDSVERLQTAIDYLKGATTIPKGSTHKCVEAPSSES
jgi:hypothetical protein